MRYGRVIVIIRSELEGLYPVWECEEFGEGVRVMFLEHFHLPVLILILVTVPSDVDGVRCCVQNLWLNGRKYQQQQDKNLTNSN